MVDADLRGSKLERADFQHALLLGAKFVEAQLPYATFFEVSASGASFRKASLPGAYFRGAICKKVDFSSADLTNATLSNGCDLSGADLKMSVCTGAEFEGAQFSSSTALAGAQFENANLKNTLGFPALRVPRKMREHKRAEAKFWARKVARTMMSGLEGEANDVVTAEAGEGEELADGGNEEDNDDEHADPVLFGVGAGLLRNLCVDGMNTIIEGLVRKALLLLPAAILAYETAREKLKLKQAGIGPRLDTKLPPEHNIFNVSELSVATTMLTKILKDNLGELLNEYFEELEVELPSKLRKQWREGIAVDFFECARHDEGEHDNAGRGVKHVQTLMAAKRAAKLIKKRAKEIVARNEMDEKKTHEMVMHSKGQVNAGSSFSGRYRSPRKLFRRVLSRGSFKTPEETGSEENERSFSAFRRAGSKTLEKLHRSLLQSASIIVDDTVEQIAAIVTSLPASRRRYRWSAAVSGTRHTPNVGNEPEESLTTTVTSVRTVRKPMSGTSSSRYSRRALDLSGERSPRLLAIGEGIAAIMDELGEKIDPVALAMRESTSRMTALLNCAGFGDDLALLGRRVQAFEDKLLQRVSRTKLSKYFTLLKRGAIEKSVRRSRTSRMLLAATSFSSKTSWILKLRTALSKRPLDLIAEDNELKFLLEKLNIVEVQKVDADSWVHVLDCWQALLSLRSKLSSPCAQQVIEAIVSDDDVMRGLGMAHAMREIRGGPRELLLQMEVGPAKHIKEFSYDYRRKIENEIAQIGRVRAYQIRFIALVCSIIRSTFVGVAQFVSNIAYDYYRGTDDPVRIFVGNGTT